MTPIEWDGELTYADFMYLSMVDVTDHEQRICLVLTDIWWRFMADPERVPARMSRECANRTLLGTFICNRGVAYERAIAAPDILAERLGTDDLVWRMLEVGEAGVYAAMMESPVLHRFPKVMARNAYLMAQRLTCDWESDARTLWETSHLEPLLLSDLRARFMSFSGIGEKISRLAERVAVMSFADVHVVDAEGNVGLATLDPVPDIHLLRTCERLGLARRGATPMEVVEAVRRFADRTGMMPVAAESLWFLAAAERICVADDEKCRCFECPLASDCLHNGWCDPRDISLEARRSINEL